MIELASVISDLRDELERAIVAGDGEELRFELGPIELEVTVAVERSGDGTGKVRFWVLELGVEQRRDTTDTQRIKLSLMPRLGAQKQNAYVSGQTGPGEEV